MDLQGLLQHPYWNQPERHRRRRWHLGQPWPRLPRLRQRRHLHQGRWPWRQRRPTGPRRRRQPGLASRLPEHFQPRRSPNRHQHWVQRIWRYLQPRQGWSLPLLPRWFRPRSMRLQLARRQRWRGFRTFRGRMELRKSPKIPEDESMPVCLQCRRSRWVLCRWIRQMFPIRRSQEIRQRMDAAKEPRSRMQ